MTIPRDWRDGPLGTAMLVAIVALVLLALYLE